MKIKLKINKIYKPKPMKAFLDWVKETEIEKMKDYKDNQFRLCLLELERRNHDTRRNDRSYTGI